MLLGTAFVIRITSPRSHGNEGGYSGTAEGGTVPQNLYTKTRQREVSGLPASGSVLIENFLRCLERIGNNVFKYKLRFAFVVNL